MTAKMIATGAASIAAAAAFMAGQWTASYDAYDIPGPDPSPLVAYQAQCAKALAFHTLYLPIATRGKQEFVNGEAHRPPELAALYARQGRGIATSLHIKKLAFDKFIVQNGAITFDVADYAIAGAIWKKIGPEFGVDAVWGGDFKSVDAVHYSCAWQGVK